MACVQDLPLVVWDIILVYLDPQDLHRLSRTSRQLQSLATQLVYQSESSRSKRRTRFARVLCRLHSRLRRAYHQGQFELFKELISIREIPVNEPINGPGSSAQNNATAILLHSLSANAEAQSLPYLHALLAHPDIQVNHAGDAGRPGLPSHSLPASWTPLHYAAVTGSTEGLLALIRSGADVNALNGDGYTPLNLAIQTQRTKHVALLLAHGANPSVKDSKGNSALQNAIRLNLTTAVRLILDAGRPDTHQTVQTLTPLQYAQGLHRYEVSLLFKESWTRGHQLTTNLLLPPDTTTSAMQTSSAL